MSTIPNVRELASGLWHRRAPHPEWTEDEPWDEMVSSYAIDDGEHLLLVDPLVVPDEILTRAAEREPIVVLTAPWHERDTQALVEQLDAPVFTPPPDTQQDLMDKFGVTAEQAGDGSPDLAWLLKGGGGEAHLYLARDRPLVGIEAFAGREHNDLVLWIESFGAVIPGDTLVDFGDGFEINGRLRGGMTREQVVERLRPLLSRPVSFVLPTHGMPTDTAALERALA